MRTLDLSPNDAQPGPARLPFGELDGRRVELEGVDDALEVSDAGGDGGRGHGVAERRPGKASRSALGKPREEHPQNSGGGHSSNFGPARTNHRRFFIALHRSSYKRRLS